MDRKLLILGSALGAIAISLGAFAAHGLENIIDNDAIDSFQTGVRYQMYHALLLLIIGTTNRIAEKMKKILFIFLLLGVLLFSGSIYCLSTNDITAFDFKSIGFVTPVGGLLLIFSWLILLYEFIKNSKY